MNRIASISDINSIKQQSSVCTKQSQKISADESWIDGEDCMGCFQKLKLQDAKGGAPWEQHRLSSFSSSSASTMDDCNLSSVCSHILGFILISILIELSNGDITGSIAIFYGVPVFRQDSSPVHFKKESTSGRSIHSAK